MMSYLIYDIKSKTLLKKDHFSSKMSKVSTGSQIFDNFIGGYETDIITTVYGPSGSGKTNVCLIAAVNIAKDKKVIFIDTEGGFSVERLKQICPDYMKILPNILIFKPTTFNEQINAVNKIKQIVGQSVGLIIVDTISMLYRLELGSSEDVYEVNRALGKQIALLAEIGRKNNIPVILTNQVYADFDDKNKVNMVGGDLLKYGSKCLIELQKTPDNLRRAIVKKHRSIQEEEEITFKIVGNGLEAAKESKGFRLF